jgi:hypothetical protein
MTPAPNSRIVPKNLLVSATHALSDEAVFSSTVRESNVRDLCTLIDLAILYDEIETLGHVAELNANSKPDIAKQYDCIHQLTGLKIAVGPSAELFNKTLAESAAFATYVFARNRKTVPQDELSHILAGSFRHEVSDRPDYWKDFDEGNQLLSTEKLDRVFSLSEKYWLRTFLYAGLAKTRGLPFVPDAVRTWGNSDIVNPNADYTQQLESAIRSKYPDENLQNLILDAPFPVPPLAATVLLRTNGDRKKIRDEVVILRDQLKSVREALSSLQREKDTADYSGLITIFGMPHTDESKSRLDDRVRDAIDALRKLKLPIPRSFLIIRPIYSVVSTFASLVTNPIRSTFDLVKKAKDLYELNSAGSELHSWSDRSAFAEVHYQLGWTLGSWRNEGIRLKDLFGDIQDDTPAPGSRMR